MGQSLAEHSKAPKLVFKTGSIPSALRLIFAGRIHGKAWDITIDTGSNISIVQLDILTEEDKLHIQPMNSFLRTVTGEKAPMHGYNTKVAVKALDYKYSGFNLCM